MTVEIQRFFFLLIERSAAGSCDNLRQLTVSAQCVGQFHLSRSGTIGYEQVWTCHKYHRTLSPCGCDIQAVQAVEKLETTRCFFWPRCRHRVDHDRGLLALKLVYRPDFSAGVLQPVRETTHLRVVRCDNENLVASRLL